ncbi:MAG: hypothetical protein ABJB74_04930 [Gemmatimonas sp.]
MLVERGMFELMQDSAKARADSVSASTAQPAAQPEFRTPQNAGYMQIAYTVAAVIYGSYLISLRRRWAALKQRQNSAAQSRR